MKNLNNGGIANMPNHKPHTYSHEDVLFLEEIFKHWQQILELDHLPTHKARECLSSDIDRCIKILEKEDEH